MAKEAIEGEARAREQQRGFALRVLREALATLKDFRPAAGRAAWLVEREQLVLVMRRIIGHYGDTDWQTWENLAVVLERCLEAPLMRRWPWLDVNGEALRGSEALEKLVV